MKKILLFTAILFASITMGNAQSPSAESANVTLNIKLSAIQSIIVKAGQEIVNLEYKNPKDYLNGVTLLQEDHLEVFSTSKAFEVSVSAKAFNKGTNTPLTLNSISINPSNGNTKALSSVTYTEVELSETGKTIVKSDQRGKHNTINITYKGLGNDSFLDNLWNDGANTDYSTTVTYAIIAK